MGQDKSGRLQVEDGARILVVRLSAIGDVVRTIPTVKTVRETLPNALIGWAVEDKAASILEDSPYIDTLHVMPRRTWRQNYFRIRPFWKFIGGIRAAGYDVAMDFHGNAKSGVVTWLSGAATRVGFARQYCKEFNHLATTLHIVPPGGINKTTSGKLARRSTRSRYPEVFGTEGG